MTLDTLPDFVGARDHVVAQVVRFARTLRANGVAVPANAAIPAAEALAETGVRDRDRVRAATHATLVSSPRESEVFAEHFPAFWYRLRTGLEATATADDVSDHTPDATGLFRSDESTADAFAVSADAANGSPSSEGDEKSIDSPTLSRRVGEGDGDIDSDPADDGRTRTGTFSAVGAGTPVDEETEAGGPALDPTALARFERALVTCPGRRWSASSAGHRIDARRALRRSLSTGGVAASLPTAARDLRTFRACVLVDVSQSVLDSIDRRVLLSFLDGLVADGRSVRVFFFDTDVREVTDVFAEARGDPAKSLERAEVAWGGGTKIGASLGTIRKRWPHAVDHRTVSLVVSDGLDVGDPDRLDHELAWLARRSASIVWLNPLAVSTAYEPTCRGMEIAVPYVDGLFAFGGSADLVEAARQLERHGPRGPVGYEHDFRDREGARGGSTA